MIRTRALPTLALLAVLLALPQAVAQTAPIHVSAEATFPTAEPGGFQEVGCLVENTSGERLLA